ncbi:MAG: YicC family protein [Parasporobacterium sp.]|nr:YicC family protein [Parasporobacterium sp.]
MISSMTGFGRSEWADDTIKLTVEMKSVNSKYLDLNLKMPRKFNIFEGNIRTLLKSYASRGKIDLYITYEDLSESQKSLRFNETLASEYLKYYRQITEKFGIADDIRTSVIARCPEVLVLEEQDTDEDALWNKLNKVLADAFTSFKESRLKEGAALRINILEKLDDMQRLADYIESMMPMIISEYKSRLEERVKEFLESSSIDEGRIAAEVTIFSDKTAIDEELVRLKTHIRNMRDILTKGGEVGRNLDFLAQEMNRESNTILSKSSNIDVTNCGIELKTCIEKIREQVQNIE